MAMATRAQQFKSQMQRSKRKAPASGAKKKDSQPRRRPSTDSGARNLSERAARKAVVATEESRSGKPSRKSTRPSAQRGKNSTTLEYVARMRSASPQARHDAR
jgi:hypothetical protein